MQLVACEENQLMEHLFRSSGNIVVCDEEVWEDIFPVSPPGDPSEAATRCNQCPARAPTLWEKLLKESSSPTRATCMCFKVTMVRSSCDMCWRDFCTKWVVQHHMTAIYHPRTNPTERRNQDMKKT
ncbi:hypothetical protein PR048_015878 [Dryococelus australis]|uniref:C2H2-type domain-containing protein n=1 Tax=Dryococelus australis TaxID=614101 RepID=A0ABQ9HI60_9NEOP|nr:hypothetical protein PR048_015878 [Dryococelus australis]